MTQVFAMALGLPEGYFDSYTDHSIDTLRVNNYRVIPGAGALLVNLGDVLARWTNDQWRSTMHRVKAPIDGAGRPFRRRSAAYFHDGNADAVIATLPGCERRDVEPYPPITVADNIAAKLRLNHGAGREASRLTNLSSSPRED
jgi:isopenicillin N synthase-like dioxygenase